MTEISNLIQKNLVQLNACITGNVKEVTLSSALDLINHIDQAVHRYGIKDSSRASTCSQIFDDNYGLLVFLKAVVLRTEAKEVKIQTFKFLNDFLDVVGSTAACYGPLIKDICLIYLKCEGTANVKIASMVTLSKVLELCEKDCENMEIKRIIEDLYFQLSLGYKLPSTVKEQVLCLLGVVAHFYPQDFIPYSDRMLTVFLRELKAQMTSKTKKADQKVISGCLLGLKEYLFNFSVSYEEDMDKAYQIYDCIKKSIQANTSNYLISKAALQLLAAHAPLFGIFLYESYNTMYPVIFNALTSINREQQKIGLLSALSMLKQIAELLPEKIAEDRRFAIKVFNYFMEQFKATFSKTANHKELNIAAVGYGYFSKACKLLKDESEVKKMMLNIIQRSEHLFFSDNEQLEDTITLLPPFIEALSTIISEVEIIPMSALFSIEKLVVFQMENFPVVSSVHRFLVTQALTKLFLALQSKADLFKGFLQRVVYQGLVRTFSQNLVADVEANRDQKDQELVVENPRVKLYTYKNYLYLWSMLLKVVELKEFSAIGVSLADRQSLKEAIYDEIMNSILSFYHKLDLSSTNQLALSENEAPEDQTSLTISSDVLHGIQPSNVNDCIIFINLVDFCRDFLTDNCTELFDKWVFTFGRETVCYSTKYPFISGFYKLVALNLNICSEINYFLALPASNLNSEHLVETQKQAQCENSFHLFSKFAREVVVHLQQFKDDLLASCLLVILALPTQIIQRELPILIPALQNTLKLGLSYLPLASIGLKTLKRWSENVPIEEMSRYYPLVLPLLDQYLVAREHKDKNEAKTAVNTTKALSKRSHKMSAKYVKAPTKITTAVIEEFELTKIQFEIVRFLGSLGGEYSRAMLEQASKKAEADAIAWDFENRNHLKYSIPFVDMKPDIYFDDFLPRVLELATTSGDRQIKVVACEVLHALVLYIVGRGSQLPETQQRKMSMEELYRNIFPGLLELACDVDQVVKQLFQPLVLQLTHWFTHRKTIQTPESQVILLSLWDGATHPENAALRDFSALCLKEYFSWSLKQCLKNQENTSTKNIFKKMHSFAIHPSPYKRLGAALVFNNLYTVFRSEENLVREFVLEMLVWFTESLAIAHGDNKFLGTQKLSSEALDHVKRILIVKADCFIIPHEICRKPLCLENADLKSLIYWLFLQCGCIQTACRQKCMELVMQFAPLMPNINHINQVIEFFQRDKDIVKDVFECRLLELGVPPQTNDQFNWKASMAWMEALVCSLECYSWSLIADIFTKDQEGILEECQVFTACSYFVQEVINRHHQTSSFLFDTAIEDILSPKDLMEFNKLKCTVLIRIYTFFVELDKKPEHVLSRQSTLWSDSFCETILLVIVDPRSLGFDTTYSYVTSNLHQELLTLLRTERCVSKDFQQSCNKYLESRRKYDLTRYFPMKFNDPDVDYVQLIELLSGYRLLSEVNLWPRDGKVTAGDMVEKILGNLWDNFGECGNSTISSLISPVVFQLATAMLSLCDSLTIRDDFLISKLIEPPSFDIKKNADVYTIFEEKLSEIICKSVDILLPKLVSKVHLSQGTAISVIMKLLNRVTTDKALHKQWGTRVLVTMLECWPDLHSWWENHQDNDSLDSALSLLTSVLLLDPKAGVTSTLLWETFKMLLTSKRLSLDFKVRVLDLLPFFIEKEDEVSALCSSIDQLVVDCFPVSSSELVQGSALYNTYTSTMKKLLSALDLTGNPVLLRLLTIIFCKEENHFLLDKFELCLIRLIKRLPVHKHQELAEVAFALTKRDESELSPKVQFAVMDNVCLSILRRISLSAFTNFYVNNICFIMDVLKERKTYRPALKQVQIIAKIGAFKLMELLYSRLGKDQLHSMESQIVKAYVRQRPETGKELTTDITKSALEFKKETLDVESSLTELNRKLCCASYSTVISVVSCTQKDLKFYNVFIFKENIAKGEKIWQTLVDESKIYNFSLELDETSNRKKQFLTLRHAMRSNNEDNVDENDVEVESSFHMMASQHLALSSLAEDASKFDFSKTEQVFSSQKQMSATNHTDSEDKTVADSVEMELDELNQHECIVPMSFLLQHMLKNGLITDDSDICPSWIEAFCNNLNDPSLHKNVKLLLARIVTNNAKILKPYGKYLLKPLMDLIKNDTLDVTLNYFILDVILAMLSWAPECIPEDNLIDRNRASCVLEFLIRKCSHTRREIFRNNLEIIKTMLECWKDRYDVPYNAIYGQLRSKDAQSKENIVGIQLLGVVLSSNLPPYPPGLEVESAAQLDFLALCLNNKYKEIYASASEVIGLILKYKMAQKADLDEDQFCQKVVNKLSNIRFDETDKFLVCLHTVHKYCPNIAHRFMSKLLYMQPSVHGIYQTLVLDLLCACVELDDGYIQLKSIGIFEDIEHKEESLQYILLQALEKVCPKVSCDEILHLLPALIPVCLQPAAKCRLVLFRILMTLYDNYRSDDGAKEQEIARLSHETLLKALADSDLSVRLTVDNFWSSEERLPTSTKERLLALMNNMYSPPTEESFLQYTTFLLLERTSHSPDYKRKVFEHPLSECNFLAYNISTSWRQRYAAMTPMFVDTVSSTLSVSTLDASVLSTLGNNEAMVRATQQQGDFSATHDPAVRSSTFNWLTEMSVESFDFASSSEGGDSSKSHLLASKRKYGQVLQKPPTKTGDDDKDENKSNIWLLRRRFIKDRSSQSDMFARRELRRRDIKEELQKEQKKRREAEVTMYRHYRIGELPDIEIPNSAIIAPIQALAQNDAFIAKMLFKSLVVSVCKYVENEEPDNCGGYTDEVCQNLCKILKKSTNYVPTVISFCLESLHHLDYANVDPEDIFVSSLRSNQQNFGILLLESKILKSFDNAEEPQRKRMRQSCGSSTPESVSQWIKLAGLYKSVYDYDVCNGIFSRIMSKDNQKALQLEASGQYAEAVQVYEELYDNASEEHDQAEKDFLDNALLFCYDCLTQWETLEERSVSRFTDFHQPDLQKIWEDTYFIDNYMPYVVRSKVKCLIDGVSNQSLLSFIDASFEEEEKKTYLEEHFSEELALLFIIQEKYDVARYHTTSCISKFLKDWKNLNSLATGVRKSKLQCLQKYIELEEFTQLVGKERADQFKTSQHVIETWQKRLPSSVDPLNIWDDIVSNRHLYVKKLKKKFKELSEKMDTSSNLDISANESQSMEVGDEIEVNYEKVFISKDIQFKLSFIKYCAEHGNIPVALKNLKIVCEEIKKYDYSLWPEFISTYCFTNHRKAQKLNGEAKLEVLLHSWSQLRKIGAQHSLSSTQKILCSQTLESMAEIFSNSQISFPDLKEVNREKIMEITNSEVHKEVQRSLHVKSFDFLKDASGSEANKTNNELSAPACMTLANFCNKYLRLKEAEGSSCESDLYATYPKVLVESLLSALRHNSKLASQLFPRLLQIIELYPSTIPTFKKHVSSIPCWMFLGWINQLVALLDKPEAHAVHDIVHNISKMFPNAIIYAFRLSCESYSFVNDSKGKNKAFVQSVKDILDKNFLIKDFVSALNNLSVPYVIFKDYVQVFFRLLSTTTRDKKEIQELFGKMWTELFEVNSEANSTFGPLQKKFAEDFAKDVLNTCGKNGVKLLNGKCDMLQKEFKTLCDKMKQADTKYKKGCTLKKLSLWLANFQSWRYDTQIEIPGQYSGKSKPMTEYHVTIAGFDEKVLILTSLTQPCRITIRGNDEKEYKILVKTGEDLRQDSRIQQLFSIMNDIYTGDSECGKRQLQLATYKVVPLSSRLGLIEWVDHTVVLNEFLMNSMTEDERKDYCSCSGYHNICQAKVVKWIGSSTSHPIAMYKALYERKNRDASVKKFDEIVNQVPQGLLKRAFLKLSSSLEAFVKLRSQFAISHSVICISQWLLGIGDRHLGNFLIDLSTGKEIGIDFGHAFGSATQFLAVPEMVPFRLTPQYLQLMSPLKEKGVLEATMVHALAALRRNYDLLINIMDIFIKEPTLDWKVNAAKQQQALGMSEEDIKENVNWYPKQRVQFALDKLKGANPCYITKKELELGHGRDAVFSKFESVCLGDKEHNMRAQLPFSELSVEEQVSCLIDQATDPHILCKTYFGWNPWM